MSNKSSDGWLYVVFVKKHSNGKYNEYDHVFTHSLSEARLIANRMNEQLKSKGVYSTINYNKPNDDYCYADYYRCSNDDLYDFDL